MARIGGDAMRWQVIPATVLGVLGVVTLVGSLFAIAIMTWYNLQYGPISPSPDRYDALNDIALTLPNVTRWICGLASGVIGVTSAYAWMRWRGRTALILTAAYF